MEGVVEEQLTSASAGAVIFPPEVQAAIETVLGSSDELDRPDLDVVQHINKLFPTEQSLAGLDDTMGELQAQVGGRRNFLLQ